MGALDPQALLSFAAGGTAAAMIALAICLGTRHWKSALVIAVCLPIPAFATLHLGRNLLEAGLSPYSGPGIIVSAAIYVPLLVGIWRQARRPSSW